MSVPPTSESGECRFCGQKFIYLPGLKPTELELHEFWQHLWKGYPRTPERRRAPLMTTPHVASPKASSQEMGTS